MELKTQIDKLIKEGKGGMEIVVSSDAEGNDFNSLHELEISLCHENIPVHPEDIEEGYYSKDDLIEKLVFWV